MNITEQVLNPLDRGDYMPRGPPWGQVLNHVSITDAI